MRLAARISARLSQNIRATTHADLSDVLSFVSRAGGVFFTADRYTVDGVSGKTAALIDHLDPTHALSQATSATQCALPAADALFRSQLSMTFAGAQYYDSNRSNEYWKFLHTGTGMTIATVYAPTTVTTVTAFASRIGGGAGCSMSRNATGPAYNFTVQSATQVVISSPAGTPVLNTPVVQSANHSESASPKWEHRIGDVLINSGTTTNAVTTTASSSVPFRLGATGNASSLDSSRWVAILAIPQVWSADERATFLSYIHAAYGIAS